MTGKYLMGVDLGTSSVKTMIIDLNGNMLGGASQEYSFDVPRAGWAEQDTNVWYEATLSTMKTAFQEANLSPGDIEAIGLSGQMHGLVCADEAGRAVRPAIIWADQRSAAQVKEVNRKIGRRRLGEWTANPLATGFMLASWLWLREYEDESSRKTAQLLLPKDFLRWQLTNQLGSEPSDASSTLLFDTANRIWSLRVLKALDIPSSLLPPIHESNEIAGGLVTEAAHLTGLLAGTPVVYGGSDQGMQALGHGIIQPGLLSCAIATGGQLVTPLDTPAYDPKLRMHTFCHVLPGQWFLLAATLSAGLSLKWLRDNLFQGSSYQELADLAQRVGWSDGLFFLPHLAGERTPYMDPASRGSFWGLTVHHHRAHIVRAVMEGVVFSMRQCLELINEVGEPTGAPVGSPVERIIASGGGTKHPLWTQLLADIFNQPIYLTQTREPSALGAAMSAGIGSGVYADAATACRKVVRWSDEVIRPNLEMAERYQRAYSTFQELYPSMEKLREASRLS
jgi:xylulokinase